MGSFFSRYPDPETHVTTTIVNRWILTAQPDMVLAANAFSLNNQPALSALCWLRAGRLEDAMRMVERANSAPLTALVVAVQNGKEEEIQTAVGNFMALTDYGQRYPWVRALIVRG